ncbi:hypothetical protein, partial [Streptomyces sp. NPDC047525]|uniref:hypothetical protein n=1 Tax=Streptomyces sp. NPDC047525 TaxID=3155264 RepID=UPI0033F6FB8C
MASDLRGRPSGGSWHVGNGGCAPPGAEATLLDLDTQTLSVDGLLPDTLSDRGNAKLFVKLYANDYRHVPG